MLKSESYKRGLYSSTVLNIIAKGIGFINTLLIAYYFGSNASTDIYFYVLSVATLITSTINGIDYLVLIPEAMQLRANKGEKISQHFLNFFIWLYGFIGLLLTAAIILSPILFFTLFSKFDAGPLQHNINVLYIGSVIIVFQLLNNLLSAILVSYKYFTIPIISALINSCFAIGLTVIFHNKLGVTGTILGISSGLIINFILLIILMKKKLHWNFLEFYWAKNKRLWQNIGLMQLNILPVWLRNYLVIYLLSGLGTGIITSVNLGQMLALLPEVFILTQMASVVGIKFSELASRQHFEEAGKLLSNLVNSLYVLLVPIALIMAVANKDIITIVFQRGGFNHDSATTTAFCFFYFALLLPSKIYDVAFTRLFTSFQVYGLSTAFAVTGHFIITIITFFAIKQFHLQGYFISLLIGYYFIMPVVFYLVLLYRFKKIDRNAIIRNYILTLITLPGLYILLNALYGLLHFNIFINLIIISITTLPAVLLIANYTLDLKYFWHAVHQIKQKTFSIFSR